MSNIKQQEKNRLSVSSTDLEWAICCPKLRAAERKAETDERLAVHTAISHLMKSIPIDRTHRANLKYLHIRDDLGALYATNGHSLHMLPIKGTALAELKESMVSSTFHNYSHQFRPKEKKADGSYIFIKEPKNGPAVTSVMPTKSTATFALDSDQMAAISKAAKAVGKAMREDRIMLDAQLKETIRGVHSDQKAYQKAYKKLNKARDNMAIYQVKNDEAAWVQLGKECSFTVNVRYFADALDFIASQDVTALLYYQDTIQCFVIVGQYTGACALVMPIRNDVKAPTKISACRIDFAKHDIKQCGSNEIPNYGILAKRAAAVERNDGSKDRAKKLLEGAK